MRALRFVAVSEDGTHLVLAPDVPESIDSGERFTVAVDERLRAASRGDISRLGQIEIELESQLRPKEIQARIRAGETPEAVAAAAGIRVERVMRYAWPVLQERETVAERAQGARVKLEDTDASPTLLELIHQRLLVGGGTPDIAWDARRLEDGLWEISSTWISHGVAGTRSTTATWRYDPGTRTVVPANRDTVELVEPAPRLVAVPTPADDPSLGAEPPQMDDAQTGPVPLVRDEPATLRRVRARSRRAERQGDLFTDPGDASDPGRSADRGRRSAVPVQEDGGLQALGFDGRLDELPEELSDEVPATFGSSSAYVGDEPEQHTRPVEVPGDVPVRTPGEPATEPSGEHGRKPRIPSWDDIVFGVKRKR